MPDCGIDVDEDPDVVVARQLGMCVIRREVEEDNMGEDSENLELEHNSRTFAAYS